MTTMKTSQTMNRSVTVLTALGLALLGRTAAAADEVIVYGISHAPQAVTTAAELRAEMDRYVESLNLELKRKLDEQLKPAGKPKIELSTIELSARTESPTRG